MLLAKKKKKSYKLRSLAHSLYDLMIIYFPKVKWQQFKKFFPPFFFLCEKQKPKKAKHWRCEKFNFNLLLFM